jgi:hypothetical protein
MDDFHQTGATIKSPSLWMTKKPEASCLTSGFEFFPKAYLLFFSALMPA